MAIIWENSNFYIEKEEHFNPWIKIFTKNNRKELTECTNEEKQDLYQIAQCVEKSMLAFYNPIKINHAMFANMLPKLHWHIQARFIDDGYFPQSLWGVKQTEAKTNIPKFDDFITLLNNNLQTLNFDKKNLDNLASIDFATLYNEQKITSVFKPKTKEDWDSKAKELDSRIHRSIYNEQFLAAVDVAGCSTLLDIGCGPGNLALRFSKKIETVYAMDYSSQMLACVHNNCSAKNISNIHTINASWDDNWDNIPEVDIVIASRSMEVLNLQDALNKINQKAKKSVYLTYKVGGSFVSPEVFKILGRNFGPKPDYIYIVMALYQMGINASVSFLTSESKSKNYTNVDEFIQSVEWGIGELSTNEKDILLRAFANGKISKLEDEKQDWALISWSK